MDTYVYCIWRYNTHCQDTTLDHKINVYLEQDRDRATADTEGAPSASMKGQDLICSDASDASGAPHVYLTSTSHTFLPLGAQKQAKVH